jgi:hypothetical protein
MRRQGANGHQLGQVWPPSRIPMVNSTPESISEARETLY